MTLPTPPQRPNPYQAPASTNEVIEFIEIPDAGASDRLTERTLEALAGTQGWVRLTGWLAVLMGCAAGLRSMADAWLIGQADPAAFWPVMVSIVMAAVYTIGGVLLLRYAGRIGDFTISRRVEHLDGALEAQRAFWRFLGASIAGSFILLLGTVVLVFWGAGAATIFEKLFR